MTLTDKQFLYLGAAVVLGVVYLSGRPAAAVKAAGQAVNPVNPENIFYEGTNAVGGAISGRENFSLGVWLYEVIHGENG